MQPAAAAAEFGQEPAAAVEILVAEIDPHLASSSVDSELQPAQPTGWAPELRSRLGSPLHLDSSRCYWPY